ncbi:hypothetical protein GH714_003841 [Hevea brasiliensis]|uniref:Pentacotripeptide-repeat region of PRORP domain-containing protein n=1 Tax=Hevea brasiliensis TaxID=3981 RepID=A0A6A6K554_HEVBR|nr:hypothetical protein GH714_003841 [Hevea brasiliensis]
MTSLKEVQDPDEALSLFHEYHQMGFKHDYPSYSALVYKLARSRNFEAVETVLGYLQDSNVRCGEKLFIALFQHYGKVQLVDKAVELFNRMMGFNCVRTAQSFNALLNVLVDNDRLVDAKELFDRSAKMGFRLNSVPFNIMIKGWLEKGDWHQACKRVAAEAYKVLFEMQIGGCEANAATYRMLVDGFCQSGNIGACFVLEEMVKRKMILDSDGWEALIKDSCRGDGGAGELVNKLLISTA